jgi:hypothetical protein
VHAAPWFMPAAVMVLGSAVLLAVGAFRRGEDLAKRRDDRSCHAGWILSAALALGHAVHFFVRGVASLLGG